MVGVPAIVPIKHHETSILTFSEVGYVALTASESQALEGAHVMIALTADTTNLFRAEVHLQDLGHGGVAMVVLLRLLKLLVLLKDVLLDLLSVSLGPLKLMRDGL